METWRHVFFKNYRGIAISSLVLKGLDNCLLLIFGSLLSNDVLQFGFQKGCSTVQCTWAVQETISSHLRKGSEVYCCLLDFSKAFDKVNFDKLFQKLLERSFPAVFLRLILYIYINQSCFIRWNLVESSSFLVQFYLLHCSVYILTHFLPGLENQELAATLVGHILEPLAMQMM